MKILAFDSSSKALSVAVVADGILLGEVTLNLKKNHSTTLMTSIAFLMAQVGLEAKELDRIAVAQGPGSYTGLRLSATVGKTLAFSLNKELVGLSSLLAIANRVQDKNAYVLPIIDARRGNAYAALYKNDQQIIADQHCNFSEFLADLSEKVSSFEQIIFTGETDNFVEAIQNAGFSEEQIISDSLEKLPSAYEIAKIAEKLTPENVHAFVPNYLKKVEAEEKWLESHEKAENTPDDYVQRV